MKLIAEFVCTQVGMAGCEVLVVDTGTANTASMLAALVRAGAQPSLTTDPKVLNIPMCL